MIQFDYHLKHVHVCARIWSAVLCCCYCEKLDTAVVYDKAVVVRPHKRRHRQGNALPQAFGCVVCLCVFAWGLGSTRLYGELRD